MTDKQQDLAALPSGSWSNKNEALFIGDRPHEAKWCMAVVDGLPSSSELVALAWGYSPEGVSKRADLIAAAPDLLEALEELLPPEISDWWCPTCQTALAGAHVTNDERCDTCGTYLPPEQADDERWMKARAAIAKARGQS